MNIIYNGLFYNSFIHNRLIYCTIGQLLKNWNVVVISLCWLEIKVKSSVYSTIEYMYMALCLSENQLRVSEFRSLRCILSFACTWLDPAGIDRLLLCFICVRMCLSKLNIISSVVHSHRAVKADNESFLCNALQYREELFIVNSYGLRLVSCPSCTQFVVLR